MYVPEEQDDSTAAATPAWMATFADLMSLLMCFFVLLLSFSEMDIQKYKQVAGSMEKAFGVQNKTKEMDVPKGINMIAREFSPGRTVPTTINTVQQFSSQNLHKSLRVGNPDAPDRDLSAVRAGLGISTARISEEEYYQTALDTEYLRQLLAHEVEKGMVEIDYEDRNIIIRIRERSSFPSGSAALADEFKPALATIRAALKTIPGIVSVEGHTDSVPISTADFRSNWDLSASRALSVVEELLAGGTLDPERFMLVGHASTRPAATNDSSSSRARNRRVEIIIRQPPVRTDQIVQVDDHGKQTVMNSDTTKDRLPMHIAQKPLNEAYIDLQ